MVTTTLLCCRLHLYTTSQYVPHLRAVCVALLTGINLRTAANQLHVKVPLSMQRLFWFKHNYRYYKYVQYMIVWISQLKCRNKTLPCTGICTECRFVNRV